MLGALDDAEQREVLESWNRQTLLVMPEACANCLLGPDPLVDPATIKSILAQCTERVFTCHLSTIAGRPRCCYTFFDEGRSLAAVLARWQGWFAYVPVGRDYEGAKL